MSSSFALDVVLGDDLPALADVEAAAVGANPLNAIFFRNWAEASTQARFFLSLIQAQYRRPNARALQVTDTATGRITGYILWTAYEGDEPELKQPIMPVPSEAAPSSKPATAPYSRYPDTTFNPVDALNQDACKLLIAETSKLRGRMAQGRRHVYLNKLYVLPSYQNRGIASLLMKRFFEEVGQRLDILTISSATAHAFYLKMGFLDADCYDVDLSRWGPIYGGFGMYRFQGMCKKSEEITP